MLEKILVLTDFSAYAQKFLEYIGDLPDVKGVVILNVVSKEPEAKTWDPTSEIKDAERKLTKDKETIKAPDVNVKVRAISIPGENILPDVPMAIIEAANEENVQTVVMGARGRNFIQSVFLGGITRELLRSGDKHLLIMRYKTQPSLISAPIEADKSSINISKPVKGPDMLDGFGDKILSKVLVPTDFSQPAKAALSAVRDIKGVEEIVLLHAVSSGGSKEEIEAEVNKAKEKLNSISDELRTGGMRVTPRVAVGFPSEVIRSMAEEEDVSIIAINSAGENALKAGRIGNITYDVANTANRPVFIIRSKITHNLVF